MTSPNEFYHALDRAIENGPPKEFLGFAAQWRKFRNGPWGTTYHTAMIGGFWYRATLLWLDGRPQWRIEAIESTGVWYV